jgi:hypothetical protein
MRYIGLRRDGRSYRREPMSRCINLPHSTPPFVVCRSVPAGWPMPDILQPDAIFGRRQGKRQLEFAAIRCRIPSDQSEGRRRRNACQRPPTNREAPMKLSMGGGTDQSRLTGASFATQRSLNSSTTSLSECLPSEQKTQRFPLNHTLDNELIFFTRFVPLALPKGSAPNTGANVCQICGR